MCLRTYVAPNSRQRPPLRYVQYIPAKTQFGGAINLVSRQPRRNSSRKASAAVGPSTHSQAPTNRCKGVFAAVQMQRLQVRAVLQTEAIPTVSFVLDCSPIVAGGPASTFIQQPSLPWKRFTPGDASRLGIDVIDKIVAPGWRTNQANNLCPHLLHQRTILQTRRIPALIGGGAGGIVRQRQNREALKSFTPLAAFRSAAWQRNSSKDPALDNALTNRDA